MREESFDATQELEDLNLAKALRDLGKDFFERIKTKNDVVLERCAEICALVVYKIDQNTQCSSAKFVEVSKLIHDLSEDTTIPVANAAKEVLTSLGYKKVD